MERESALEPPNCRGTEKTVPNYYFLRPGMHCCTADCPLSSHSHCCHRSCCQCHSHCPCVTLTTVITVIVSESLSAWLLSSLLISLSV